MLLFGFLLLPMILVASIELTIDNYIINIENDTLTNVKATQRSTTELNLEELGLRLIDNGTFDDQKNIKFLSLANNSLVDLPDLLFSNLTNLEHLSLADNNITTFRNIFVGLASLKTLNISNNPVGLLGPGEFYGLSNSVNIFTSGSGTLQKISHRLFDKSTDSMRKHRRSTRDMRFRPGDFSKSTFRVKACVENGKLNLVDFLKDDETLTSGCTEILSEHNDRVFIESLNITCFEPGWFRIVPKRIRLNDSYAYIRIWMISLSKNMIVRVTPEMLNNLPKSVIWVDLDGNKIERFERGAIENYSIRRLFVAQNSVREIQDGAFEKTKLEDLTLDDNLLRDMKFVNSLPPSFKSFTIQRNQLTEIPNDTFLNHPRIDWLSFDGNRITKLHKNSLRGISYLYHFGLSDNQITRIDPGSFRNIRSFRNVHLRNNSIAKLEKGVFDGPEIIDFLDLGMNKFTNVTEQIRDKLPKNLYKLMLDFNDIGCLQTDDFVDVPIRELNLRGNKIKNIASGSMMLRGLTSLDLGNNSLTGITGEIFENFGNIWEIRLDGNSIAKIEKGFAKHLVYLRLLDISRNPIKKLENGALHGIRKDNADRFIVISQTPIEIIQGGLFEATIDDGILSAGT